MITTSSKARKTWKARADQAGLFWALSMALTPNFKKSFEIINAFNFLRSFTAK